MLYEARFVVLMACKSVDRSTCENVLRSTLLHANKTTKKNAFNSYNYI